MFPWENGEMSTNGHWSKGKVKLDAYRANEYKGKLV